MKIINYIRGLPRFVYWRRERPEMSENERIRNNRINKGSGETFFNAWNEEFGLSGSNPEQAENMAWKSIPSTDPTTKPHTRPSARVFYNTLADSILSQQGLALPSTFAE